MHCQGSITNTRFPSIMKEGKTLFPKTTTLHNDGKLSCASFPYNTRTSALRKTTLPYEGNIMHAIFPSITSTNVLPSNTSYHNIKLADSGFLKETLHHEQNLMHARFSSIMKENTNTIALQKNYIAS